MTHPPLDELLTEQHDCVAVWQLCGAGWTRKQVCCRLRAAGMRPIPGLDGVWTSTRGPLTTLQRWSASTLTAPGTALSYVSGARLWGLIDGRAGRELFIVVTRRGRGGPRRHGDVLVCRSRDHPVRVEQGVPVLASARILADLASVLDEVALRHAVIEALRLERVVVDDLVAELERAPRRPGMPRLRRVVADVSGLPIARARSNAEGEALVRRRRAGRPGVDLNVRIAGYEADLVDPLRREIIEIDGPAFHPDADLDERKAAAWRARGYTVVRRPSADVYDPDAEW